MELTNEQKEYLFSRECGTAHQKKMAAVIRTALSSLKNDDKPTGVTAPIDFDSEILKIMKLAW